MCVCVCARVSVCNDLCVHVDVEHSEADAGTTLNKTLRMH